MDNYTEQSAERLREIQADLERQYAGYQARNLKLDMSRGKPSGSQLDLTNGILDRLDGYMVEGGID
ncbi:MAG: aminotransferase, partial [Lentisphaeria bacterium]|nr:aminotransferase [Lentisphaeria bacterium]